MPHAFTFFRAGGFDQVRLATADDLINLHQLDRKLWAALACPVQGLEFDDKTLALLDADGDGRVRLPELLAAIAWCREHLVDIGCIIAGADRLPLAAIAPTAKGRAMVACAQRILARSGKAGSPDLGIGEISTAAGDLAKTRFNGDGVLPPATAEDPVVVKAIADILTTRSAIIDLGGDAGLDRASLAAFLADAAAWLAWWDSGQEHARDLLPAGEATPAALAAVEAVRAKIDDFFLRCRAAAFDPRAAGALARSEADWAALAARDLTAAHAELASFPLAGIAAGARLPLAAGLNPVWTAAIATLRRQAVAPLLGDREELDEASWRTLTAKLEPFRTWRTTEAAPATGRLGASRLRELTAPALKQALDELFRQDEIVKPEFDAINDLERLVRYHRSLFRLLQNFVSFADFYDPSRPAVFQAGTLYFDGRSCDLCVKVGDMARHGLLAGKSMTYLLYCECSRPGRKMTICAAVTNGDNDGLLVGRNGLFLDRQGDDWDATVIKVIENPISIREAFWSPYKRAARFVEDFAAKRAAEADKEAESKLAGAATAAAQAAEKGKGAAPKPKLDVGVVAALGVAVGGITAAIGALLHALFGLGYWIPLGLLGLVLLISGPSMILAWLKLRQRNLGPILDASGWAVNGRVRINIPFGAAMTQLGALPANAHRILGDPYAEKRRPWRLILALLMVSGVAAWAGVDRWRDGRWWWDAAPAPEAAGSATAPAVR